MPIPLVVGTEEFQYPLPGDQNWGEDATNWAESINDVITTIAGPGFIPETTVTINDNVSSPTNVLGAVFDSGVVRANELKFSIQRTDGASFFNEWGKIKAVFNGTVWDYSISSVLNSGVVLTVTNAGQVQYTSSSVGGTYAGDMTFSATAITD